ncbi:carboxymuconolactone decarboxylase family protein [Variovorax sp. J22G21]|uniref:carboxymuconolactone decarboxylase family protein n=1 Tax=Variovorax fucosicus TaxID=3053517 RepID=UPI002574DE7D|nr:MULTISPECIES: carboxymuconolactone decarboxylase family protein [unclassified Variovorax]MDM0037879.1 carboxymuconolactone decarboxylase family protein [Variovorax sp. J22R193]MDM0062655.1 carboxymuconolactone decarboxylase family protein [Variovorax sp. J22G21]
MPRISIFPTDTMSPEQRVVYDKIVSGPRGRIQGPLRAALHNPELADKWQALGALLRYGTTLPPRLSELAILVTGRACNSPFEWYAHRAEAEKAGIEQPIIEAILAGTEPPGLSADDAAIYHYAIELNRHNSVSDAIYGVAQARFGERTVVELTALIGYYTMVAMTLNCHEIPLPEGVAPAFALPQHTEMKP